MTTNTQINQFQHDTLKRVMTISPMALIGLLVVLGSMPYFSVQAGTATTPTPSATPSLIGMATYTLTAVETPLGPNVLVNQDLPPDGSVADQRQPALAVGSDGTIHIAWADERFGNSDIFYARSTDGGAAWSPNVRVNDDSTVADQDSPTLEVDEQGHVYVAWEDSRNGDYDIYYAHSVDGGMTFSANRRVNDDVSQGDQFDPAIAIGPDGTLHLAWQDGRNAVDYDIYYAHSTNDGTIFFPNVRVNDETLGHQVDPTIGVGSTGRVHVAYCGSGIYYANSNDDGASFSTGLLISYGGEGSNPTTPSLATAGSNQVHVAWEQYLTDIPFYVPGVGLIWIPVYGVGVTSSSDGGESFSEPKRISDMYALNRSMRPDVAASNDIVHIVFYRSSYGDRVIEYDRSTDGGDTWGADQLVDDGNCCPSLDIDTANRIYVAWSDYRDGSQNVYHTLSADEGQSFPPGIRINDDAVAVHTAPDLAVDGSVIHAVWSDNHSGLDHIYHARSTDGGLSFGLATQLDQGTWYDTRTDPAITVDAGSRLHVIWTVGTGSSWYLWYAGSVDSGGTFSDSVRIAGGFAERPHPALAVDGSGHIHVVWEDKYREQSADPYQYYVYYARSTDGGASFPTAHQISDGVESGVSRPDIAVDGSGRIYVVWQDGRRGEWDTDVYADHSTDGGATWGDDVRVNEDDGGTARQRNPAIAVGGEGWIHVTWQEDGDGDWDIYHASSTDYGVSYGPSQRVNDIVAGDQTDPAVAVGDEGQIYASWSDLREDDGDVRYAESTDGGNNFSASVRVNDQIPRGWQGNPAVTTDGNRFHLVWEDTRNGPPDIYYASLQPTRPALILTPATATMSGLPGTMVTYTLQLTNTGNTTNTYDVTVSGNVWTTTAPATVGPLAEGSSVNVDVTVDIPANAAYGDSDAATITLTSQSDPTQSATSTLTTTGNACVLFLPIVSR